MSHESHMDAYGSKASTDSTSGTESPEALDNEPLHMLIQTCRRNLPPEEIEGLLQFIRPIHVWCLPVLARDVWARQENAALQIYGMLYDHWVENAVCSLDLVRSAIKDGFQIQVLHDMIDEGALDNITIIEMEHLITLAHECGRFPVVYVLRRQWEATHG